MKPEEDKPALCVSSEAEMVQLGASLVRNITEPQVFALHGDLGAGKTTLAKGMVSALAGISPAEITSPTFQYVHLYPWHDSVVAHCDLWRLRGADDFLDLGLDEYLFRGIALVEWPERISTLLPGSTIWVHISLAAVGRLVVVRNHC